MEHMGITIDPNRHVPNVHERYTTFMGTLYRIKKCKRYTERAYGDCERVCSANCKNISFDRRTR